MNLGENDDRQRRECVIQKALICSEEVPAPRTTWANRAGLLDRAHSSSEKVTRQADPLAAGPLSGAALSEARP